MPVPSAISDLSTTPGLNSPAGSESPASIDDYLRTHAAFIKQLSDSNDSSNVKLTGNQTVAGTKTFSSPIDGSVTGTALNVTGIVAISNGGTGQVTAVAAFNALKQPASETATGVVELATSAEAQAGTDAARALTPAGLRAGLNASDPAPVFACRAWVNFNGTGAVSIRGSGNVSSITDNGQGTYTVNLSTPLPDANACVVVTVDSSLIGSTTNITSNSVAVASTSRIDSGGLTDSPVVSVAVFR